jgi:hypothetical protein
MIRKSLCAALVILGAYHFALPHLSQRFYQILGQQRGIYLRGQHYLYDVPQETKVIVGGSMAGMLNDDFLGPGYVKLTVPGDSSFTALEIIRRTGNKPTAVLIETNVFMKDANQEILHDLFSPGLRQLRRYSEIFREQGRPSNFVAGIVEACVRKSCLWTSAIFSRGKSASIPSSATPGLHPALAAQLKRTEREEYDSKPSPAFLTKRTKQLADYVDLLSRNGSICILFEMPIDSSLSNLSGPRAWREAMKERFPEKQYHWLSFESNHNYQTSDGIHLVRAEADRLTEVMIDYVNNITQQATATSLQ